LNFVNGQLESSKGEPALRLTEGSLVHLNGHSFKEPVQQGQPIILGLRPEQILLKEKASGATTLPLKFLVDEPMGADTLIWSNVGKDMVSARVAPDQTFSPGDSLQAHFLPNQSSVFDAASGNRL
jgi:multiple sugar transport system ATP-binding protein